ncbi:MAG: class I SAM-dependent methyltransferase [Hyphomicrobiales bacterium]|nr:class I SAM-dependent methyltransferase [Hyphomicrobiales bacterium]MCP4997775.1 class I SAM-dependent methyltransferase [Hyphomicrobiales bacterium]
MNKQASVLGANTYGATDITDFYDCMEEYQGTYKLAVHDLPDIIARHVTGTAALDFACGCGRSTRFVMRLGFDVVGADVSEAMLTNARRRDPEGKYFLVGDGDLGSLKGSAFNLILSAFPLSNMTTRTGIAKILTEQKTLLAPDGRLILIEANPILYHHEWVSFTTAAFPENVDAKSGDPVPVHYRGRMDKPVVDILWTDEDYRHCFKSADLRCLDVQRPLAAEDDPGPWFSEREIAPWVIYVLEATRADKR